MGGGGRAFPAILYCLTSVNRAGCRSEAHTRQTGGSDIRRCQHVASQRRPAPVAQAQVRGDFFCYRGVGFRHQ